MFWITGLSGAGKTTVAGLLARRLRDTGHSTITLDGDVLRAIFGKQDAHTTEQRRELAMCYSRLCREISGQGHTVVCSTISLFHAVHTWNRENIPRYIEVFLDVPMDELKARNSKGIYNGAEQMPTANVVGVDLLAEAPQQSDIVIKNCGDLSAAGAVAEIWRYYEQVVDSTSTTGSSQP